MTCLEKLESIYPNLNHEDMGKIIENNCPDDYNMLPKPSYCAPFTSSCETCWNRVAPAVSNAGLKTMTSETFNKLLDELDGNSLSTLKAKNARYSSSTDCLHNFRSGAEIAGVTPAQCAWGYMTKHLVALRDKVQNNDFSDREDLLEKCQDIINYIRFIWVIGNDD